MNNPFLPFLAVVLVGSGCVVARADSPTSALTHDIEYSKPLEKTLFPKTKPDAMSRSIDYPKPVQGFTLRVTAKSHYKVSEAINVQLTLTNINTDARITHVSGENGTMLNYDFLVLAPNGNPTMMTSRGRVAVDPYNNIDFMFHRMVAMLFPSRSQIVETVQLNRYFDMTQKGTYTIGVSRRVFGLRPMRTLTQVQTASGSDDDWKKTFVVANPLYITVE